MFRPIVVLALLLPLSALAAEIPLTQPVHGPAAQSQFGATAASDGDGYLVVWSDSRANAAESRATRVTRDGEVLDPTGIKIPVPAIEPVSVVWTGTSYLLVWSSYGPDGTWMLRMNRDGAIVDGPRVLLEGSRFTSVAKNDTHVVIAYMSPTTIPNEHRALFLSPDGARAADVKLAGQEIGAGPQIAWNGSHFAAAWLADAYLFDNTFRVSGIRFTIDGPIEPAPRTLFMNEPSVDLSIASDGTDFVVLAREYATDVYFARRLSADLMTVGPTHAVPESQASSASLYWSGTSYVVLERGGNRIGGVRLDREGRPLDSEAVTLDYAGDNASISTPFAATNGRDLLVVWSGELAVDFNQPETDVFGTIVSAPTLSLRKRSLLTVSAPRQSRPLVANGGTNLLAVWQEKSGLYAKRLARDGSSLDATPLRLSQRGQATAVVFNGSDYIVLYGENFARELVTARVPRTGALRVENVARVEAEYAQPLAAASDGTTTLVLWMSAQGFQVSRLGADGAIAETMSVSLRNGDYYVGKATLAPGDDGTFLLVWEEIENTHYYHTTFSRIRGARVTRSLLNLDPAGIDIATASFYETQPAVTWNGSEWLVAWAHLGDAIRGRLVAANGTLAGPEETLVEDAILPSVAWDGARYVVTWLAHGQLLRTAWTAGPGSALVSERTFGKSVDGTPAALVPIARGTVAAAYARVEDAPQSGGVPRAFLNLMSGAIKRRAVR